MQGDRDLLMLHQRPKPPGLLGRLARLLRPTRPPGAG